MFNSFIREQFKDHKDLKILFRSKNQKIWDQFLEKIKDAHFYHFSQELNYQSLYQIELGFEDQDLSFIILNNNEIISLFGLSILRKKDSYFLGCNGRPVLSPIFRKQCSIQMESLISEICFDICEKIAGKLHIKKWYSNFFLFSQKENSEWIKICKKKNCNIFKTEEGFIKLTNKEMGDKKYLKKIKEDHWEIKKFLSINKEDWNLFKNLHLKVSGKKTRSDKTWESQFEDLNNNRAFAIFLYDKNKKGSLVGGNIYRIEKNISIYAVGVNDRSYFPKSMSIYSFYHGIIEMLNKNIKWLSLGDIPSERDFNNPTSKEISIGEFKRRLSTDIFEKFTIERRNLI